MTIYHSTHIKAQSEFYQLKGYLLLCDIVYSHYVLTWACYFSAANITIGGTETVIMEFKVSTLIAEHGTLLVPQSSQGFPARLIGQETRL